MGFNHARAIPTAGMDHVVATITAIEEYGALGKALLHLGLRKVADGHARSRRRVATLRGFCAGNGKFLILGGARCAANANPTDNLSIEHHGNSPLQGS